MQYMRVVAKTVVWRLTTVNGGLARRIELSEHARMLITQNLKGTEFGLMNGTQCDARRNAYAPDWNPNHEIPRQRLPSCIIVDVPKYSGPAFFRNRTADRGTDFPTNYWR